MKHLQPFTAQKLIFCPFDFAKKRYLAGLIIFLLLINTGSVTHEAHQLNWICLWHIFHWTHSLNSYVLPHIAKVMINFLCFATFLTVNEITLDMRFRRAYGNQSSELRIRAQKLGQIWRKLK